MAVPDDRKYSKGHVWCKAEGSIAVVGITDFGQKKAKEIVFAELPKPGQQVEKGKRLASVESVKAVLEITSPISGEVVEANREVEKNPGILNSDPYGKGWIAKVKVRDGKELAGLMNAEQYEEIAKG